MDRCTSRDCGGIFFDGGELEILMEYLEGETLAARIARGPMPLNEVLKVAIAIADALDKAHAKGVTHRDLKPGNIMITSGGAKLLDFGLAKFTQNTESGDGSAEPSSSNTTTPGTILGTMQYMTERKSRLLPDGMASGDST